MSQTDKKRLTDDALHPRIVDLWFALQAMGSVTGLLQSGAHPDDETSGMLAPLRFRDGLSTAYVCSTRGEGGQNDIGTETGRDLGTLRTAEMERAADALDMRMWWLSETPEDSIYDFGFSKSGTETMAIWGRDRVLARFVDVVRTEKPDILLPTFLNVGGQHGHHRAMTEAAHEVFDLAADPDYAGSTLPVWTVSKLYLPAWGGGGGAYDDEVPPPPETVTVAGKGSDPVTGWSWANIGERSRACHRTQGMGRWVPATDEEDWPLHLAASRVGNDRGSVTDNLPRTLADLGLHEAQAAITEARAAYPDCPAVAQAAARALMALQTATVAQTHQHRLDRKRQELARVLWLASRIKVQTRLADVWLKPGASTRLNIDIAQGDATRIDVTADLPKGWSLLGDHLTIAPDASLADPYPTQHDPLRPAKPALKAQLTASGAHCEVILPFTEPPVVGPVDTAILRPTALLLNLDRPAPLTARVVGLRQTDGNASLLLPKGWGQEFDGTTLHVTPPAAHPEGLVEAALMIGTRPAITECRLDYPHIAPRLRTTPTTLRVLSAHIALPTVTVGYVGNGSDTVAEWLTAMGLDVRLPSAESLVDGSAFDEIGALVVGVFGFRNPALAQALPRLHRWVREGGTLVSLYHRPGDNWDPDATPPARIEIGSPSLRWRVTDQNAHVTHLAPTHPVLTSPNVITPEDWQGWSKERGLYFASRWDPVYTPLLAMADPDEQPHHGALLSADIGAGRHNHVALNLHHQMPALVPGAFRLMANLLAKRG